MIRFYALDIYLTANPSIKYDSSNDSKIIYSITHIKIINPQIK